MSEVADLTRALETRNQAFVEFQKATNEFQDKVKKGEYVPDNVKAHIDATQKEMAAQKAIIDATQKELASQKTLIETLEAKSKRPLVGNDGKPVDEQAEEHRKAFGGYVKKGVEYSRDIEQKALGIQSGPDGGFAVPKVIDTMIDALAVNISPVRSVAQVVQVSTPDYHRLIDIRGTTSGWVGETQARPATNTPQLVDISPPMGDLYAMPAASQMSLDDILFNAEQWLADSVATEFARAEGAAHINGTGINQPRGFATYPTAATADATRAFGTIERVNTGVSADFKALTSTVNPVDDLYSVVSKMKAMYRPGCSWMMPKATMFKIMAFKDYQGRYVFTPTTAPGVADMILGYPIVEAEDIPVIAASSLSLWFANWKRAYLIVDRVGTRVIRDPFTSKPNVLFYTTRRSGGSLLNSEAIKALQFI